MNNKRLRMLNDELGLNDYAKAPNSQSIIEKVNNSINADPVERRLFMRRKFISSALVAALILSIASLTVIAATLGWHHKLIEYFNNPTAEQMDLMNGAFDAPMVSGTDNGYTVNVLNTLADKHGIYVLYELVLPPDKVISETNVDEFMRNITHFVYLEQKKSIENDNAILSGIGKHKILGVEKNKITLCEYNGLAGEIADEYKVRLSVGNMKYVDNSVKFGNTSEEVTVFNRENAEICGDFNIYLTWNFKYEDKGKSISVNEKLDINGINNNTLNRIDISPISIWIIAEGDAIPSAINPVVKFKDGTTLTYNAKDKNAYGMFSNYQTGDNNKGYTSLGYVFDEITDIKTIESITIGDQIIKVN